MLASPMIRGGLIASILGLVSAWLLPGCVLERVSLEGRPCPCVEGFVCDELRNVCVRTLTESDAGVNVQDAQVSRQDASLPDTGRFEARDAEPRDAMFQDAAPLDAETPQDAALDGGIDEDAGDAGPLLCTTDRHCPSGMVCEGGQCENACFTDSCLGNLMCDSRTGHCFNPGANCQDSADCGSGPPVGRCIGGSCQYGCGVDSVAGCVEDRVCGSEGFCEVAPTCNATPDCGRPDFVCSAGACVRRCDAPGAYPCHGNSTCQASTGLCSGNELGANCIADANCASGVCLDVGGSTFCSRTCGATADCPLGMSCRRVGGARRCIREAAFNPPPDFDVPSGQVCMNPGNACQSSVCNAANQCVERCSQDAHCLAYDTRCVMVVIAGAGPTDYLQECAPKAGLPDGMTCTDNDNDQCESGICYRYANECAGACCSDLDCGAGEACVLYDVDQDRNESILVCRAKGGARTYGQGCTIDSQCEGVCGPRDPNNLAGALSCTTHCCTDQDCAVYPGGGRCATVPSAAGQRNLCVPLTP